MDGLNRSVEAAERVVEATPPGHPDQATHLNNLGIYLTERFTLSSSIGDLHRAIEVADMAIKAVPQNHPDRLRYLDNLGTRLGMRFDITGSMDDLNRAIELVNTSVEAAQPDHPNRGRFLCNLAIWLCRRFEGIGLMDDLDRAVGAADMAVKAVSEDSSSRANYLSILGNCLGRRYEQTDSLHDLDRAISVAELSLKDTGQDSIHRAAYLTTLGMWLGRRSDRTGSKVDLDRAVEVTDMAVEAVPPHHPNRAIGLINLGMWLSRRFDMTGSMSDLNRSVEVSDVALKLLLPDSPSQTACLHVLAMCLSRRFDRAGSVDDLDRAIEVADLAVKITSWDHPERTPCLDTLASCLGRRFDQTGSIDDLNRAVDVADMAVKATPQDHPFRASHWDALGVWLDRRFDRTGSMDDLNRAIQLADMAVEAAPPDHMERASFLNNLGCYLDKRFERAGSMDDLTRSVSCFREGWNCPGTPTSIRIRLALSAAATYASQSNWEESSQLLEDAVELLPAVSPRSSSHNDKEHVLASFVGLASMAAAVALNAGKDAYHALKLLELGRGIIANLLMDMRGNVSDLKQMHPDLAEEFVSLRDELDSPAGSPTSSVPNNGASSLESQAKRRREADQKFSEVIAKIRAQPGFGSFFLPPTADELMAAANLGPIIVVNMSLYRCDAFVVERHRISVVELPALTQEEVQKRIHGPHSSRLAASFDMGSLLEWLWDAICRPCLDALGFKDPPSDDDWPRVWWIPTRLLSRLPLHAAGHHAVASADTVMDRVMSSYASSIKALIQGRRHTIRDHTSPEPDSAVLIAMRETPNLSGSALLPFAIDEIDMLAALCPSLRLKPIMPPLRKDEVLKHFPTCKIFHFAGHGKSDPADPSRSCLLLEDWKTNPLTAGALRDHRLQDNPPFFAYLSACSTGANEADRLADEGVHLVHAFQLAGFRHVIGTLWEVRDKHCVDVAREVYKTMQDEGMTDVAVCRGLHRAVRALRDSRIEMESQEMNATLPRRASGSTKVRDVVYCEEDAKSFDWVPYVHFGV
ncbi:CHAT domain-containing protein [Dactylonectria macrodidyma]|uniref:CHAT domain-containing protein n=1 Tax=Dactylonectria macrodidyma TaxID=307937 RepID=A0A9P9JEQ2_9HYPO|nr:CHAT domain-containing protein [Dactylonectria macrodidyma]